MEMKIMNSELRAAQDQLDRAAKRGWSRGRNVALHFEPRRIIAFLLFMEFYKYMYHPVHVFFRHRKTLSLFNNRRMLEQTKLFVFFYKIWLNWLETLSAVRLANAQSIFTNNDKRLLSTFASKTLLLGNLHIKGHSWRLGRTDQGYRRSQKWCRMNFRKDSKPQLTPTPTPQKVPYLWKFCACISYYLSIIPPRIYMQPYLS